MLIPLFPTPSDDHAGTVLPDEVRHTMTVSKIQRVGRSRDGDSVRLIGARSPTNAAVTNRTGITVPPALTLTFTASRKLVTEL